ncbi:MAG: SDR family NAD(P)-dependent oxidoreductase [Candidatus Azotimanducaceae bacterium WSBS_2022_MAG_OTU7]
MLKDNHERLSNTLCFTRLNRTSSPRHGYHLRTWWRFAIVLAACGAKVAITGRRAEKLEELAAEIRATGGVCEPIPFDITNTEEIVQVVDKAESALGLVDILINNAGIPDAQRAHKMSNEFIDTVFDTNLVGPFKLSCEVAHAADCSKSSRAV